MFDNQVLNLIYEFVGVNTICLISLRFFIKLSKTGATEKSNKRKKKSAFINYEAPQQNNTIVS